ncbi:arginine--tRNA ligase [Halobacteriota archaeon]
MFIDFKNGVRSLLQEAVESAGYEAEDMCLEETSAYADMASSVAFKLSSKYKEPPQIIAKKIFTKIKIPKKSYVDKADVIGPYINFYVNREFLDKTIEQISADGENYGSLPKKDERAILEHTSVNPTGPIHVGRGRNPIIGDTLARILRRAGYDLETQFYVNDMGKQIATIVWGFDKVDPNTLSKPERDKPDHDIVRYYRRSTELISEDPKVGIEVNEILAKYESGDPETIKIFKKVVENCMAGQRRTLERINIYYDRFVWESQFVRDGSVGKILEELKKTDYVFLKDGALTLDLKEFGLEKDFVLTRSDGITLYTTRDIAYHLWKFDHADVVINVLGEDQKLAMSQLQKALKILGIEKEPKIVFYSFVSLPEGRMSTREGIVVDLDDLLDEAFDRAYIEVQKRRPELPEDQKRKIAGIVGMGAVRFDIIKVAPEKMMTFRWEDALDFEKQGAPFIQYAHARACSILGKAHLGDFDPSLLKEPYEVELIKKMAFFPRVIASAAHDLKPNIIAIYARELAETFNQFYLYAPVLKAEDDMRKARLALVNCARIVLANVLDLLGIVAPESM